MRRAAGDRNKGDILWQRALKSISGICRTPQIAQCVGPGETSIEISS